MNTAPTVIRLNAGNDTNGNPRRVYVVIRDGDIIDAIDEGYRGSAAWTNTYPDGQFVGTFATTAAERKELLAHGEWYRAKYVPA